MMEGDDVRLGGVMTVVDSSAVVCPTEDAIQAFREYLVDPMLPAKSSEQDTPSLDKQGSVAKQMHAVVLLYNYFLRKQHRQLRFEGFEPFCKLSVVQKQSLFAYMKFMQRSNNIELNNVEKQLSLTERAVLDACKISRSLDASIDVPSIEGWPIMKVAVFLIDSKKENCFLQMDSITMGVRSVIEKETSFYSSEYVEGKHINKKIKATKKPLRDEISADEVYFQKVAFSAVKEAAGLDQKDLIIVGTDVVYSLTREKTVARFYTIQCTQPNMSHVIDIPIKDVVDSLQGPLVILISGQWATTPVVEYFHLLPYAGILKDLLSRELTPIGFQVQNLASENINLSSSRREKPFSLDATQEDSSQVKNSLIEFHGKNPDMGACSVGCQREDKSKTIRTTAQMDDHLQRKNKIGLNGATSRNKVEKNDAMTMVCVADRRGDYAGKLKDTCGITLDQDCTQVDQPLNTYGSDAKDLSELHYALASKQRLLSETALRVLLSKRDKLTIEHRNIEDEIAMCDKKIQIICKGGKDSLDIQLESVLEGCNGAFIRRIPQEKTSQPPESQCSPNASKMKQLSEAVICTQTSCQELDGICCQNNWVLPTYRVSPLDGGFGASVTVKGVDFECSCTGGQSSNTRGARESAAAQMLVKLQSMPGRSRQS